MKKHRYFTELPKEDYRSFATYGHISCFIAAAHQTLLAWLHQGQTEYGFDGKELHSWWYGLMEVVKKAKLVSLSTFLFLNSRFRWQMRWRPGSYRLRRPSWSYPTHLNIEEKAKSLYGKDAK
jgi:hypothetical protein